MRQGDRVLCRVNLSCCKFYRQFFDWLSSFEFCETEKKNLGNQRQLLKTERKSLKNRPKNPWKAEFSFRKSLWTESTRFPLGSRDETSQMYIAIVNYIPVNTNFFRSTDRGIEVDRGEIHWKIVSHTPLTNHRGRWSQDKHRSYMLTFFGYRGYWPW